MAGCGGRGLRAQHCLLVFCLLLSGIGALQLSSTTLGIRSRIPCINANGAIAGSSTRLQAIPSASSSWSFSIADGLDADTLGALGNIADADDGLEIAVDSSNAAADILTRVVSSPAIIAVPIGAGLLVAFLIGYFIFSYGSGRDD